MRLHYARLSSVPVHVGRPRRVDQYAETRRTEKADRGADGPDTVRNFDISFKSVGWSKQSWTTRLEMPDIDHCPVEPNTQDIARIMRDQKAIMFHDFDVTFSDEYESFGVISVGNGRHMGSFRIVEVTA